MFPAKILGRDSQLLSTGEARLYTKLHSGVYWPPNAADCQKLPESAAILKMSDGSRYALRNMKVCPHSFPDSVSNHCDFDYDPLA